MRSTDLYTAAAYAGLLCAGLSIGQWSIIHFGDAAMGFWALLATNTDHPISGHGPTLGANMVSLFLAVAPLFALPAFCVITVLIATRSIVFAPEKLAPKANRIDPISNAKQKFGRSGLFEFFKSVVKFFAVSIVMLLFLRAHVDTIIAAQTLDARPGLMLLMNLLLDFITIVVIVAAIIAAVDYLWQRFDFLHRNRMTRQELLDEPKRSDGDPQFKAQRRQRAMDLASQKMLADLPKADVVIVNPTHFAVALKWERDKKRAPVCVAKGVDEMALTIRQIAKDAQIPIHPDPPTARALHKVLDIGDEISPEHYQAVATAIRFAEKMRRLARERRGY